MSGVQQTGSNLIGLPILLVHNFVNNGPFLTKPVSNESPEIGLSIGTGFVKNGSLLSKLWTNNVGKPIKLDPVCWTPEIKTPVYDPSGGLEVEVEIRIHQ